MQEALRLGFGFTVEIDRHSARLGSGRFRGLAVAAVVAANALLREPAARSSC